MSTFASLSSSVVCALALVAGCATGGGPGALSSTAGDGGAPASGPRADAGSVPGDGAAAPVDAAPTDPSEAGCTEAGCDGGRGNPGCTGDCESDDGGPAGTLVLFGGFDASSSPLGDTWTFDGTTWTQVNAETSPPPRGASSMATLGGKVVLFGGDAPGSGATSPLLGDTWVFDGSSWSSLQPGTSPPARCFAGMATLGGKVVLFGGQDDGGNLDDTWTFDGSTWTQVASGPAPSARDGAVVASLGNEILVFGGWDGAPHADTWAFDGTTWTQVTTASSPTARAYGAMTALGGKLMLFGGFTDTTADPIGSVLADTWAFDGSTWTAATGVAGPPARRLASMGTLGSSVVLFGGSTVPQGAELVGDTWRSSGSSWTQVASAHSPPARFAATMARLP